jgi:phosphate starvation-inducible protein PhoH and related proteins
MNKNKKQFSINQVHIPEIRAYTDNQEKYINAIKSFKVIIAMGPAGTGKTYLATILAAKQLNDRTIKKIIITRPAVEVDEKLGFLPGELNEKFEPYLWPVKSILSEVFGDSLTEYLVKTKSIEAVPLAYLRGRTFKDCWVLLDEAQNTTPRQMKMFVTRYGINCKMIINGDPTQKDINGKSGLDDVINKLSYIPSVKIIDLYRGDIVRHGLVGEFIQAYEETDNGSSNKEL